MSGMFCSMINFQGSQIKHCKFARRIYFCASTHRSGTKWVKQYGALPGRYNGGNSFETSFGKENKRPDVVRPPANKASQEPRFSEKSVEKVAQLQTS